MKSSSLRLQEVASWESLRGAWKSYRSGKRRRASVAEFELDADRKLLHLSKDILTGRYRHGRYRLLEIRDPKPRLIAIAPVRDRIVHKALHDKVGKEFQRSLIDDTYACLPERGTHRAIFRFQEFQSQFCYLLHLDVRRFYPDINHSILFNLLQPKIRDSTIVTVLGEILRSGWELYSREKVRDFYKLGTLTPEIQAQGLPIGNLTSQWWGNLYLSEMDHFIKRQLKVCGYIRHMDDFVLFANDRKTLIHWQAEIEEWLGENRRLKIRSKEMGLKKCTRRHLFLGYTINRRTCTLSKNATKRFRKSLVATVCSGEKSVLQVMNAWANVQSV